MVLSAIIIYVKCDSYALGHRECCLPRKTICHGYVSCMLALLSVAFQEQRTHPYNQQLSGIDIRGNHNDLMPTEIEEYR